ncbi:class I SAM-dependent methyltransferase [Henriciella sp.]|uniref:class I SAM-dependent methyltransferase n=1 Tax=Henriciella sp. TaxID=1968823 RepID=UPI002626ABE1|nr:class I SAM-dependent methyltransferase [Henriciella sp.]
MEPFGKEHAAIYDTQFEGMSAARDGLQLIARLGLSQLPENARILCAGAGTGTEVLTLGAANPGWHFMLADPAPAMLDIARRRLDKAGLLERCSFHAGYLDTLSEKVVFDGATALLVSHFLTDLEARTAFFREIVKRLAPGGTLISADLAADRHASDFTALMQLWQAGLRLSDIPEENVSAHVDNFGRDFAAHTPDEVESAMVKAGFNAPDQVFQMLLIRAWKTRRP